MNLKVGKQLWFFVLLFSAVLLICSGFGCFDPSSVRISVETDTLKRCLKNEDLCLMVLGVATKNMTEKSYSPYVESLKSFAFNYQIIGKHLDWHGWITRGAIMKAAMMNLKNNFTDEELRKIIIVTSDTGDVLVQGGPNELLNLYKQKIVELKTDLPDELDTEKLIIVGGEWACGANCEKKASSWFDRLKIEKSKRYFPHPQGGFLMGPPDALLEYYTYTVEYMDLKKNDDQIAMGNFALDCPRKIYIDYQQEIVATIAVIGGDYIIPDTGLNTYEKKLYKFTDKGLTLGDDISAAIGRSKETVYPPFLHIFNNTRSAQVKDYWDDLVAHLKQKVWKN